MVALHKLYARLWYACMLQLLIVPPLQAPAQTRAFPGAEGAGAYSVGGRGGDVYYVTTLADNGPGSLRNGIATAPAGGRTILFKVSGNIILNSTLTLNRPRLTVAGQTAPGDGICLQNYAFNIGANDIIVRHLRTRTGTNALQEADSMWINSGTNIIVDHVSASWSVDETLSASGRTANLTVQWCYITESLNNSIHSKGAHGYGSLITPSVSGTLSWHHNLYAHHHSRNPRPGTDSAATVILDFRNNAIYNYGDKAGYGSDWDPDPEYLRLNYVGNYVVAGPDSAENYVYQGGGTNTIIYQAANLIDLDLDKNLDGLNHNWGMFNGTYVPTNTPFPAPAISTDAAPVALQRILAQAGAMPWRRDPVDARVTESVRRHAGSIIDSTAEVGGWPPLNPESPPADTDSDGMPDYWELALGLNPNFAPDRNTTNAISGYTQLEDYLSWLADPHAVCSRNGHVDVNLRTMSGSTTNLTYTVADGTNGTVSLLPDGYTARFTARPDFSGRANFTFAAASLPDSVFFGPANVGILLTTTNANQPPVLVPIANSTVMAGINVAFTCYAIDNDMPPQSITYALHDASPGALLGTNTGAFAWRPSVALSETTNTMAIVATDNGVPSLSATQRFTVTVLRPARPTMQAAPAVEGQFALSVNGDFGPDYTLQASSNLVNWTDLFITNLPALPFYWADPHASNFDRRFYRTRLGP